MHCLPSIYFSNERLHVLSRLTAHHQEILLCIYNNWYMSCVYVDWLLAGFILILPTASQHKRMTYTNFCIYTAVQASLYVMAHAQKPDFVFRRNGRIHLTRQGRQFSRPLAAEGCASPVVILDTPCSEVVWRVLATHSIRQFPLHFPSRASPCAITFQLECTPWWGAVSQLETCRG